MNRSQKRAVLKKASVIIASFVIASFTYMFFDNVPPYEFKAGRIEPDPAKSGQRVNIIWQLGIRRICPGTVYRKVAGPITSSNASVVYFYDPIPAVISESTVKDMKDNELVITFQIPDVSFPGTYHYSARIDYRCNWLQRVFPLKVDLPIIPFYISREK